MHAQSTAEVDKVDATLGDGGGQKQQLGPECAADACS